MTSFRVANDTQEKIQELEKEILGTDATYLYRNKKDAIVSVNIGTGGDCSGFYISSDGYVVTCAHCVIIPTGGADFLLSNERDTSVPNTIVIKSTQFGVIKLLDCTIIGIDVKADVAVLKPKSTVSLDTYFNWGISRAYDTGQPCFIAGDSLGNDFQSISMGVVKDNRYVSSSAEVVIEGVSTDASSYGGNSGGAIVDRYNNVIGLLSTSGPGASSNSTYSIGPSQYLLERIVNKIISTGGNYQDKAYFGILASPIVSVKSLLTASLPLSFTTTGWKIDAFGIGTGTLSEGGAFYNPAGSLTAPTFAIGDIIIEVNGEKVGYTERQTSLSTPVWFPDGASTMQITFVRPPSTTSITVTVPIITYGSAFGTSERLTGDSGRNYI